MDDLPGFQSALLAWYRSAKRDLPWRRSRDPYAIWVSEAMLQQTTVRAVMPYYERWMERFPTLESLAAADEQEALSYWQGLGYYRRCKALLAGAREVVATVLPVSYADWLNLPGVGPYTAAAITSIAHDLPQAVMDGNVARVYARLTGDADSQAFESRSRSWAETVLVREVPGDWNQALMELGALVCTPKAPNCNSCPVMRWCEAARVGDPERFPPRRRRAVAKELTHTVWVPSFGGRLGISQIEQGKWWEGLWEFPRDERGPDDARMPDWLEAGTVEDLGSVRHTVTHHKVTLHASLVHTRSASRQLNWIEPDRLASYPMPSPQRRVAQMALRRLAHEDRQESHDPPQVGRHGT